MKTRRKNPDRSLMKNIFGILVNKNRSIFLDMLFIFLVTCLGLYLVSMS